MNWGIDAYVGSGFSRIQNLVIVLGVVSVNTLFLNIILFVEMENVPFLLGLLKCYPLLYFNMFVCTGPDSDPFWAPIWYTNLKQPVLWLPYRC